MNNSLYWSYNLPLQISPHYQHCDEALDGDTALLDESGKKIIKGYSVINYMPRKNSCSELELEELLEEQSREEFLEYAAQHLENLARLLRECIHDPDKIVYYADEGFVLDEDKLAKNTRKPE
jgi:hypothetical protein